MGCDIHVRVEVLRTFNDKTKWTDADYYSRNPYYEKNGDMGRKFEVLEICGERNYPRFAVLAGVRNYYDTIPICEPKGIPKDCNKHIRKDYESWGSDAHTPSWFTLKELIDYQSANPIEKHSGYISPEVAALFDEKGETPNTWYQVPPDKTWDYRSWECKSELVIPLINALTQRLKDVLYFYDDDKVYESTDKIRMVFWFDN